MEDRNYNTERSLWRTMYFIMVILLIASNKKNKEEKVEKTIEQSVVQTIEQTFDEGEHIISVPIDNPKKEIQTYEYHDGYKVIDIENNYILYVNDEPVKCIGYIDNNEEVHFIEFGEPVENENTKTESKTYKLVPQEQLTTEE